MSQEFMNLGKEYRDMYEQNINQMLEAVINDNFQKIIISP